MFGRMLRLLPGLWAGLLLCIAALAAPAAFAALPTPDAGRVVGHIFVREAWISLALAAILLTGARHASPSKHGVSSSMLLWGTVLCTAVGYFLVLALMPAARVGQGLLSFGQLHLISTLFYGLKTVLVLLLAWRAAQP